MTDLLLPEGLSRQLIAVASNVNTARNLYPVANPPVARFWRSTDSESAVLCHDGRQLSFNLIALYHGYDTSQLSPGGGYGSLTVRPLRSDDLIAAERLLCNYDLTARSSQCLVSVT